MEIIALMFIQSLKKEKVSLDRQRVEYDCLTFLHSLIPGKVPQPYCIDTSHNISKYSFEGNPGGRLGSNYVQK